MADQGLCAKKCDTSEDEGASDKEDEDDDANVPALLSLNVHRFNSLTTSVCSKRILATIAQSSRDGGCLNQK